MAFSWDPARYLGHADHRARPFHDLLARVDRVEPARRQVGDDVFLAVMNLREVVPRAQHGS